MSKNIGINGFGRIGRVFLRASIDNPDINIIAINDITNPETLAHLFKYDSVHGRFDGDVSVEGNYIKINGKKIEVFAERDPENLPWKDRNIEMVIESTGIFRSKELAGRLISRRLPSTTFIRSIALQANRHQRSLPL